MNRSRPYIIYCLIALAFIGLASQLIQNPGGLFRSLLMIALVTGIVYFVYKRLTKDKPVKKEQRAFIKAARQSKKRQKLKTKERSNVASFSLARSSKIIKPRKKSDVQLTVIEGKKNKKKNRALF
ncbi:SA1362 family protein [Peribacillus glennii]|uniref:SA1362 family protein n=1 Tax=Peribacillus glennii TaxID=2303991 RepID=UPI0026ABF6E9